MTLKMRSFHWNEDFETVRQFLIDTYNLTKTFQNWIPSRFENRKFGPCVSVYKDEEDDLVKIWEEDGKVVAVTNAASYGRYWIQIHPDYRHLEEALVQWIEQDARNRFSKNESGEVTVEFVVPVSDSFRISLLSKLGYEDTGNEEHNRVRPLDMSNPDFPLPDGYEVRHVELPEDFEKYSGVVNLVFGHCNMTEELAMIYTEASFYFKELDLVVVAPDGYFASFVTVRIDPISKHAEFEPVGTHPDYRGLGLAKGMLCEGLRRIKQYNPTSLTILGAAPTPGATRLYDQLGFDKEEVHSWKKKTK